MELAKPESFREKELALGIPADAQKNVFVSLENTAEQVTKLIAKRNEGITTFMRAPVATGKSEMSCHGI